MGFSRLTDRVIKARNFTPASRTKGSVKYVVIHTMESPEAVTTAEDVAVWMAGSTAPQASAHYGVDVNSIVGMVDETDVAWGAAGANSNGMHIEHAGKAGQTREQWADQYSRGELNLSAKLCADIIKRWGIRRKHPTNSELAAGSGGVIGHNQVSEVIDPGSGHWDPGPGFPWKGYMEDVEALLDGRKWQVQLRVGKQVLARSSNVGTLKLLAKYREFSREKAPRIVRLRAAGKSPVVRIARVG